LCKEMKKYIIIVWSIVFVLLVTASLSAYLIEIRLAEDQNQRLHELIEDIFKNQDKWKDIALGEKDPFLWSKNLGVGHGLIMDFVRLQNFFLIILLIQMTVTIILLIWKIKKLKHNQMPSGNPAPPDS